MAAAEFLDGEGDAGGGFNLNSLVRTILTYFVISRLTSSYLGKGPPPTPHDGPVPPASPAAPRTKPLGATPDVLPAVPGRKPHVAFHGPAWSAADRLSLEILLVEVPLPADGPPHAETVLHNLTSTLSLGPDGVSVHMDTPRNLTVAVGRRMHDNETQVVARIRLSNARDGRSTTTEASMHKYLRRKRAPEGPAEPDDTVLGAAAANTTVDVYLAYLRPTLHLEVVPLDQKFPAGSIPKQLEKFMVFDEETGEHYPILHLSTFWTAAGRAVPINGTVAEVEVEVDVYGNTMWKWQLKAQMEEQWAKQEASGDSTGADSDMLRRMLLDTNPVLLAVTFVVSLLHTAFDFLAFKNDISFYRGKRSMEGLSVRTMAINAAFSVVIFLYLADNDTSAMVLFSNGAGCAIEMWKLSRAVKISFEGGKVTWVENSSYAGSATKKYDEIATRHLLFVTMPLVAGYGAYSLAHMKHKGWYSWVLSTLVGFIYMFGFVMMTPQLFINYKLQSVAHLNWRTMMYKSLNTFVDDLFAFVIKMPLMHRLACLRDDVVFFVFLYQRHVYKTDYSRVNEFGQCTEPAPEETNGAVAGAVTGAAVGPDGGGSGDGGGRDGTDIPVVSGRGDVGEDVGPVRRRPTRDKKARVE